MPCLSGSFNPQVGPLLRVAVVDVSFAPAAQPAKGMRKGDASPVLHSYDALIDTGATATCISEQVVADVGLAPTGKTLMTGATGASPVDQFAFGIGFILPAAQAPTGDVSGSLWVKQVHGCLFAKGSAAFDVLLGRDVICSGALHLSFDGHFTLSV